MKRVNKFLLQNYNKEISLELVASIAMMNKTSFCRYFKIQTGKTFSTFINDLRIHYSKKLLIGGTYSIKRIAYEVGYNNPTYFTKLFTLKNAISPNNKDIRGVVINKLMVKTNQNVKQVSQLNGLGNPFVSKKKL